MKPTFTYAPTTDLRRALTYYRDVIGLDEAWREGTDTVAFALPGSEVQLMVSTTPIPAGPMYLVDSVSAWLDAHPDLDTVVKRYDIPGGSVVGFADPDGNTFYVFDQDS